MRIQYLSDLHLEFHGPRWREFVDSIPVVGDVLVLAGDIAVGEIVPDALSEFRRRYRTVLFVCGNHEYYGSRPDKFTRALVRSTMDMDNMFWLEPGHTTSLATEGVRFVGCTLWFPRPPAPAIGDPDIRTVLNDFYQIRDFEPWVYERNAASRKFLEDTVRPGDIVVTHYLPHPACLHPKYRGSPLNPLFVCDMSDLIERAQPALWIHGHTHESVDITVGKTRIVCNPYGYHGREVNRAFRAGAVVEVEV